MHWRCSMSVVLLTPIGILTMLRSSVGCSRTARSKASNFSEVSISFVTKVTTAKRVPLVLCEQHEGKVILSLFLCGNLS